MMDYAKQIANKVKVAQWAQDDPLSSEQIDTIVASVPKPECVAEVVGCNECGGPIFWRNAEALPVGTKLYAEPVSAEPVNARLLDALKDLVSASVNEVSCQHGVVEKCQCRQCSRIRAREVIAAAEQAKPVPELTDERIEQLAEKFYQPSEQLEGGIFFDKRGFARAIERELRGEGK